MDGRLTNWARQRRRTKLFSKQLESDLDAEAARVASEVIANTADLVPLEQQALPTEPDPPQRRRARILSSRRSVEDIKAARRSAKPARQNSLTALQKDAGHPTPNLDKFMDETRKMMSMGYSIGGSAINTNNAQIEDARIVIHEMKSPPMMNPNFIRSYRPPTQPEFIDAQVQIPPRFLRKAGRGAL